MMFENPYIGNFTMGIASGFALRSTAFVIGVLWQMIMSLMHSVGGPR